MKGKRGIILLLLLVLVGGAIYWQFFLKKKPASKKKAKPKTEAVAKKPSPAPLESPRVPPVEKTPAQTPGATVSPQPLFPGISPKVSGTPSPQSITPKPAATPPAGIPRAEQLSAETQPLIQVSLGPPIRIAEGSTFFLETAQVQYAGNRPLRYQWELVSGPNEFIEIQGQGELKARITLGNFEEASEFILRLRVTDGMTEALGEIKVQGFPAKLEPVAHVGGAYFGIQHMGSKWVAAQGNSLEILGPELNPIAKVGFDFSLARYFATVDGLGRGALFVQSPEGDWTVVQPDPVQGDRKSRLTMMGKKITGVVPFQLDNQPYIFALLPGSVELWNMSDPRKPRLKSSIPTQIAKPLFLTFLGRHLYLADEGSINLLDFSTGRLIASVPSGGSLTDLSTYSVGGKNYLLASIGFDRTPQQRKDYGLRLFEIGEGGRLGTQKRISIGEGLPVNQTQVIPGRGLALLSVTAPEGIQLKLFDLVAQKLIPLEFSQSPNFLTLGAMQSGKLSGEPVAVIADGNQLRVFGFKPTGESSQKYQVRQLQSIPGIMSAGWIQSTPGGELLWVGDEGSQAGGSLTLVQSGKLKIIRTINSPDLFPVDGDIANGSPWGAVLYLSADPRALPLESPEGSLGLAPLTAGEAEKVPRSPLFLGIKSPQGELRPLAISALGNGQELTLGFAISRVVGAIGGSGLGVVKKPAETPIQDFLKGNIIQGMELIPLQDARDVVFTSDGQGAFLASGLSGVIGVDLAKKNPVSRMSLGGKEWFADRVLLGNQGKILLGSFIQPTSGQVLVKIFGIGKDLALQEYGTLTGLKAVRTVEGLRAPRMALTQDDLYLFLPMAGSELTVFNLTNPALPLKITGVRASGEIRGITLTHKFRDIYLALGPGGVSHYRFDFVVPAAPEPPPVVAATATPVSSPLATPKNSPTPAPPTSPNP